MIAVFDQLISSGSAGALTGAVTAWLITRHRSHGPQVDKPQEPEIDPLIETRANRMASRWAKTHNWPEAQGVVADKLRLSWVLQRRRGPAPLPTQKRGWRG